MTSPTPPPPLAHTLTYQHPPKLIKPVMTDKDVEEMQQHMAAAKITDAGELERLQQKQRAAVEKYRNRGRVEESYPSPPNSAGLHPDLQELSFGEIGSSQKYDSLLLSYTISGR